MNLIRLTRTKPRGLTYLPSAAFSQDNKYKDLFKPTKAHDYDYVYRDLDPSLTRAQKLVTRTKYTIEDTQAFIKAIMKGDTNAVMFRTAGNLKRQIQRTKDIAFAVDKQVGSIKHAIVEGFHHTVHGLKDFGKDSQWLIQTKVNADQYKAK